MRLTLVGVALAAAMLVGCGDEAATGCEAGLDLAADIDRGDVDPASDDAVERLESLSRDLIEEGAQRGEVGERLLRVSQAADISPDSSGQLVESALTALESICPTE